MTGLAKASLAVGAVCLGIVSTCAAVADPYISRPQSRPAVAMSMLLEKTIFQVDVLTLDLWLGPASARDLQRWLPLASSAAADSVAVIALNSRDAWAAIRFRRNVKLAQFLDGIDKNMRRARDAGHLASAGYDTVAAGLPRYFAPLAERGIEADDRLFYRIRGDTLRTVFQQADGLVVIDQVDVGPERRLSLLGSFFVAGSEFRRGLLASLPGTADR
jgi:hypothetical protein